MCMLLLLVMWLCSFFWGCISLLVLGTTPRALHMARQTLYRLYPGLHPQYFVAVLQQKKPVLLFHAVPYFTSWGRSVHPLDWPASYSRPHTLQLLPVTAITTPPTLKMPRAVCCVPHTLTLTPQQRALCHKEFERKSNSIPHNLAIKGTALPSDSEESWLSPPAYYTYETGLNSTGKHP